MKFLNDDALPTGDISKLLGFIVEIKLLLSLNLKPLGQTKNGTYWRVSDIPAICTALQTHLETIKQGATNEQDKN